MIALHHDHPRTRETGYRSSSISRPRESPAPQERSRPPTSPTRYRQASVSSTTPSKRSWESTEAEATGEQKPVSSSGGASRFPSPPDSSSPNPSSARQRAQEDNSPTTYMASATQTAAAAVATANPVPTQQPSPEADAEAETDKSVPPRAKPYHASTPQGHTIVVRDLAHIQSLARADMMNSGNGPGILNDPPLQAMKYEISGMPIGDIIEMVAALLTKITTTNDLQHDALHRNAAHQQTAASHNNDGASMSPLSSSVLAFHGKNVPAITILSYLSRIHKYCPTTYEVFLSLLVYFDRMTERVNNLVMEAEETRRQSVSQQPVAAASPSKPSGHGIVDTNMKDETSDDSDETDSDLADDDNGAKPASAKESGPRQAPSPATYFVVDSFNIHRLIIAGVTCASKFFSDVFYTNSRYAKVGGLPLAELNHLELQFLLLNDFRLSVAVEDLEAYATMLVEFYAREVVAQRPRPSTGTE
ncbi:cyclin-domain-containing protein [Pseudomassariella vexata]|uniref:Cyclin-domain-containing protein n=1 Tax=Pseudomassariella vexata TaxID=1141098 RepID=A0A1Y2E4V2_9PEZI|nr:cyclin-domain-containing protein [Pseudomassariella vexata]ORY66588.1 cyclin-domain-containing protein [Pseudomassariella vexata]